MDPILEAKIELADEHSALALHNLNEMEKIKRWRKKRLDTLLAQGTRAIAMRPTTIHDPESVQWALAQSDPKLTEYGAGLTIVERRAAMHASIATDLRLQVLTTLLARQHAG